MPNTSNATALSDQMNAIAQGNDQSADEDILALVGALDPDTAPLDFRAAAPLYGALASRLRAKFDAMVSDIPQSMRTPAMDAAMASLRASCDAAAAGALALRAAGEAFKATLPSGG